MQGYRGHPGYIAQSSFRAYEFLNFMLSGTHKSLLTFSANPLDQKLVGGVLGDALGAYVCVSISLRAPLFDWFKREAKRNNHVFFFCFFFCFCFFSSLVVEAGHFHETAIQKASKQNKDTLRTPSHGNSA